MKLPSFIKNLQSKTNIKEENILSLDIGTEYIKAMVYSNINSDILVKGYAKIPQSIDSMHGAMVMDIQKVIDKCDEAIGNSIEAIMDDKDSIPSKVVLGIAGEIVQGVTYLADYERKSKNEKITESEIEKIITNVRSQAFESIIDEIVEKSNLSKENIKEISTEIIDVFIDGFRVYNPVGFVGEKMEFRLYSSYTIVQHLNSFYEIGKSLGLEISNIFVQPFALARSIKGAKEDSFSAILIDIGGGTTDIAVIKNGSLIGTKMFNFGGRVLAKRLSSELRLPLEKANEKLVAYSRGSIVDKIELIRMQKAIENDCKLWATTVEIALSELNEVEEFPEQIYLCGGGSLIPDIKQALMNYPFLQTLPFRKFPKISYLEASKISSVIDKKGFIKSPADVLPLALARCSINK